MGFVAVVVVVIHCLRISLMLIYIFVLSLLKFYWYGHTHIYSVGIWDCCPTSTLTYRMTWAELSQCHLPTSHSQPLAFLLSCTYLETPGGEHTKPWQSALPTPPLLRATVSHNRMIHPEELGPKIFKYFSFGLWGCSHSPLIACSSCYNLDPS